MMYKQVKVNLTPEHYAELEAEAKELNTSIAKLIRDKLGIDLKETPKSFQRSRGRALPYRYFGRRPKDVCRTNAEIGGRYCPESR